RCVRFATRDTLSLIEVLRMFVIREPVRLHRRVVAAALVSMLAAGPESIASARAGAAAVGPARVTATQADSLRAAYAHDREEAEQNLRHGATSYLAAVARTDFGERPALVVGRAADCDLRVDDVAFAAHHLRVTVAGDSFRVEALDPEASFRPRGGDDVRAA